MVFVNRNVNILQPLGTEAKYANLLPLSSQAHKDASLHFPSFPHTLKKEGESEEQSNVRNYRQARDHSLPLSEL